MAIVACFNITSLVTDGSNVCIDRVVLGKGQSAGIVYRSEAVDDAVTAGLISIVATTAVAATVLTEYINSLNGLPATVYPLPVGPTV